MDGKRKVCATCRWFIPSTEVCTNDQSDKCADFVDGMEDSCERHEMWPGLNFDMDKIFSTDARMSDQRETEHLGNTSSQKKKTSYNKRN